MNFQNWLQIDEMAHVGMKRHIKISCAKFNLAQCKNQPIAMIDMRFEDPGAYQPPYNKFGNFSKFSAKIPDTNNYLTYHGAGWADTMSDREAMQKQFVPIEDERINKTSGATSEQGYMLVPDSWYIHAQLIGIHGNIVKPAMGDVPTPEHPNGKRQAFLDGKL